MRVAVGIDLVAVASIEDALRAHAPRYLDRVYTEREVSDCGGAAAIAPERLAARFAAKEAALKVLRPPDGGIPWRDIEVRRGVGGWAELELTGAAAALAADRMLQGFQVSLSHEGGFATAVVVAVGAQEIPQPAR